MILRHFLFFGYLNTQEERCVFTILNYKRATRSDSLFVNGVVSIKSCSHAETYRIVKTNVLTLQR